MKKNKVGLAALVGVGAFALYTVATLPPAPPAVPPVPSVIPVPNVPELTAYDMPTGHGAVSIYLSKHFAQRFSRSKSYYWCLRRHSLLEAA